MFKKILIANRGEIATRIIKTAKRMGIKTVAVYSEADKRALHIRQAYHENENIADEAIYIGPAPASESYLKIDKIIAACKETGADAVHPGYGFLSENPEFAKALAKENITFIGPPPSAIEAMGDKITSKKIAEEANVSIVPGYMGLIYDEEEAIKIANDIGYPVMIKASAGGGGKGMRIAYNDTETKEGFVRSKSEAKNAFSDDRIFIEKFITRPRHIEIQILADSHGNTIHLGERECSIQRRNQKVIEEAPSPFLDEATRQMMGEQAISLAQKVGYTSAGTVEFIIDQNKNFYFLEMNTRLQVEHPVTELITGIDLVEQMIRVAAGEELTLKQKDIKLNGWAMESRIYAEDPYKNFIPSSGRLTRYRPPAEQELEDGSIIRNDTGVYEGAEISIYYDPMIAKLCTWGKNRNLAIDTMSEALELFELEGLKHNLPFLITLMKHAKFRNGDLSTAFIDEEFPKGFHGASLEDSELKAISAITAAMTLEETLRLNNLNTQNSIDNSSIKNDYNVKINEQTYEISVELFYENGKQIKDTYEITFYENELETKHRVFCDYWSDKTLLVGSINTSTDDTKVNYYLKVAPIPGGYQVRTRGANLPVHVMRPDVSQLFSLMPEKMSSDTSKFLLCPMPGSITKICVTEGQTIEEGETLVIVEAMKMENTLRAEKNAKIKKICVSPNSTLAVDDIIMEFE